MIRVIRDYRAQYTNPLSVRAGEQVDVQREDETYPGWWWCVAADGRAGWVPVDRLLPHAPRPGNRVAVVADYTAVELSVAAGDQLTMEEELREWMYVRNAAGESGWIPASHTDRHG